MRFDDFIRMISILHVNAEVDSKVKFLFRVFDMDNDEYISKVDLQGIVFKLYGFKNRENQNWEDSKGGVDPEILLQKMNDYIDHVYHTYDQNQDNMLHQTEFDELFSYIEPDGNTDPTKRIFTEDFAPKLLRLTSVDIW